MARAAGKVRIGGRPAAWVEVGRLIHPESMTNVMILKDPSQSD